LGPEISARALKGLRILVVEDNAPSAKLASLLLTTHGAEVRVAPNAEEALRVVAEFSPQLVALDLILPRMGGLLLAQHIKGDPQLAHIVIVATTVITGPEVERMAREAGCAAYVRKPIDTETFAAIMATSMEKK
jgi:CheY-like chemotaxis protein